jgi:integrase
LLPTYKHSTQRDYRSLLRRHLLPAFGNKRLRDIQRSEIQLFLSEKGKYLATKTVHHLRVLLSRILGVAMEWGYLHENNARGVKLPKQALSVERTFLTVDQARRLIAALGGVVKLLVTVAVLTGLRRCELFGLRWKHIDFGRQVIRVRESLYEGKFNLPKTKSSIRDVPMGEAVCSALLAHRQTTARNQLDDLVFANERGSPLNPQQLLRVVLYPACDRLGLPRVGWHAFRHTHATLLSDGGEPIKLAQAQLGHSDLGTTLQVYTHVVPESQRQAVAKLERTLFPNVPNFAAGSGLTH